jgi:hypothetical protein
VSSDPWGGWQAFNDAARSYLESVAKPSAPSAAQQFSDFLREQSAAFSQPWNVSQPTPPPAGFPGSASEAPAFGATREHQQRAQRTAQALARMEAAQRRLQRMWSDVLRDAATEFVAQLTPLQPGSLTPQSLRRLYDGWIDCAEDAYARVAHGEAFCQAQAELANASSQWRLEQQANVEQWSKFLDLPTRSEVNSLMRRLKALESQLRAAPPAKQRAAAVRRTKKRS